MIAHATALADWVLVLPVVLPILGAAALLMVRQRLRVQFWLCAAVILAVLAADVMLFARVLGGGPLSMTMGRWLPPFGISFTADVLGAGFATLAAFVAFAVVLSLVTTAPQGALRDGVYPLVLLLLAGVSGAVLTGDLFNLYVWFEVMLIASFGLIVLAGHPLQLDAAVKYAVPNVIATTLLLLSLGLIYGTLGTLNMADVIGRADDADPNLLAAVAALFLLAVGIKAAVFPVNAWLPASYHAPPPAITALIGGLSTKVGAYAVLRLALMLMPSVAEPLAPIVLGVAVATSLLGPFSALAEANLRRAVGFLLIGGVGNILLCVAPGHAPEAIAGGVLYVAHAVLTVSALYLVTGLIETAQGTGNIAEMSARSRVSWPVAALFFVLVMAISGIPPFLGFWPKLLLLQGFIQTGDWLLVFTVLLNSLLTLIVGARLWSLVCWRPSGDPAVRAPGLGAAVLVTGAVVLVGLSPQLFVDAANVAAAGLLDPARYIAAVGVSP